MKNVNCARGTYYNGTCNRGAKITCSAIGIVQLVPGSVFTDDCEFGHEKC